MSKKRQAKSARPKAALRDKQQAFIEHYLQCWNATEAARRAGYSDKTAYSMGWENLRKPEIRSAIEARLAEFQMSANEVLARLASQAQASMGDFLDPETWQLDLKAAQSAGKLHLVKKLKHTRTSKGNGDDALTMDTHEIELHDAQSALALLARGHGLLLDKTALTDPTGTREYVGGLTDDERNQRLAEILEAARNRRT